MLERDEKKSDEEMNEGTDVRGTLTGGWFSALRKSLVGAGEDIRLQGRRPLLFAVLLIALCAWFLGDGTGSETSEVFVAPSKAAVPQASLHEEVMGAKEAREGKALADPFSLMHGDEQATLAAMVAVGGGDEKSVATLNNAVGKAGSESRTGDRRDEKNAAAPSGAAASKTGNAAVVVPQVRGTVTSNVGTVLLLSVGGRDFFLAEGEEKEGVLLQSLSDKSAVVVIGGRSYTLNLPG